MHTSTKAIFLGIALSISLSSCATSPTTSSIAASNSPTASATPASPTTSSNPGASQENTLKLMIQGDAALQNFAIKQAQQICLNELRTLEIELNLPTALDTAAQATLEAQGVTFKNNTNLSFSFAVADVQSLIAGFSKTLPGLSPGTLTATTHLKNSVGNTMGSLTYTIVIANGNKDVQILLKPAEPEVSGVTCSALLTEITGAELKTTAGGILATVAPSPNTPATPTPNPTPTANPSVPVASIKMNVDSRYLNKEGETKQLTATLFDAAGNVLPANNVSLIWQSARPQDISVDSQGKLKAIVGLGYAPVTVTVAGTDISDTIAFDVSDPSFFTSPTRRSTSTPTPTPEPTPSSLSTVIKFQADVAMDDSGDFVVAWSSLEIGENKNEPQSYGVNIRAQRYNANGSKRGNAFKVNTDRSISSTTTGNLAISPSVAMDSDGDFVVAWVGVREQKYGSSVHIQRYNSNGVKQGSEILIDTSTSLFVRQTAVAMDADGDFVVSWEQQEPNQSNDSTIHFQRYNRNGAPQGNKNQVSNTASANQFNSAIAMNDSGRFAISWISGSNDAYNVYVQSYANDGTSLSTDTQVNLNEFTESYQNTFFNINEPSVAMDNTGGFVVGWTNGLQDTSTVLAQRFDNTTQKQGSELLISDNTTFFASTPDVAMDSDGDFIVSWSERDQQSKYGIDSENSIYAKTYTRTGNFIEQISDIESQLTASGPSVALDDDGDAAFAWQGRDEENAGIEKYSIYTKRYNLNLNPPQ